MGDIQPKFKQPESTEVATVPTARDFMDQLVVATGFSRDFLSVVRKSLPPAVQEWGKLALYVARCSQLGIDPMSGGLYPIALKDRLVFTANYRAMMGIAERTGEIKELIHSCVYEGENFTYNPRNPSEWKHEPIPAKRHGIPMGAYCFIARKDGREAFTFITFASRKAYSQKGGSWADAPDTMIMKCAIREALSALFPMQMNGVYSDAELPGQQTQNTEPVKGVVIVADLPDDPVDGAAPEPTPEPERGNPGSLFGGGK